MKTKSAAVVADLKSLSFVKRLALWLGREGLKVKEQDLKVEKVASHALEVVNRDRKFQTLYFELASPRQFPPKCVKLVNK